MNACHVQVSGSQGQDLSGFRSLSLAGRADYFGNLPNTAARVMSLAKPGQFLIEGSAPWPTPLFTKLGGRMYDFLEGRSFRIAMRDQCVHHHTG